MKGVLIMNKTITKTKNRNRTKLLMLTLINHFAAALGSLGIIIALGLIGLGHSFLQVILFVFATCLPAILLLIFKAVR
jgi:hypothetical protein